MSIVGFIAVGDLLSARKLLEERVETIMAQKLHEMKKRMMAEIRLDNEKPDYDNIEDQRSTVSNVMSKTDRQDVATSNEAEKTSLPSKAPVKPAAIKEEVLDEARIKIIKARIRGGKIQRRKKVSNVPGMTFRGGTLKRMSPAERRRRKLGQRRGKIKRQAKMSRIIMKRSRSMRKRKSMGI